MPSGEMRRPPQLWEQRLARTTSVLGVGLSSGGDTTAVVPPTPPPGAGGGTEPAPVGPPPGAFIKPSTPQLLGSVQSIRVLWDGLNSAGDLWPYDTSFIEVHMATSGTAFTPGTATLQGRLARPGGLTVSGLTAGTTYHFRFVGADPAGNVTPPSDAASGQTGLTTSSDYGTATIGTGAVSFNARQIGGVTNTVGATAPTSPNLNDVWLDSSPGTAIIHKIWNGSTWVTNAWGSASIAAGQVTALQIAAGAVTAGAIAAGAITADKIQAGAVSTDKLTAGTITGFVISGGTITGNFMTSATIEGSSFRTASSGARLEMGSFYSSLSALSLYNSTGFAGSVLTDLNGGVSLASSGSTKTTVGNSGGGAELVGPSTCTSSMTVTGTLTANGAFDANGNSTLGASGGNPAFRVQDDDVYSYGIDDNTTASAANVRVGASAQLLRSTSTVRLKDELTPLDDNLTGVPPEKLADFPPSVDPYDVLTLTATEFRSLSPADGDGRNLGFIAEDVAAKLPWAANWDDDGLPSAVEDRPILAALLWVVQQQQATITDLRARIEALEA